MYTDIRTAIIDTLKAVPGIGIVHDFERYSTSYSEFKGFYIQANILNGWYVTRKSRREYPYDTSYNRVVNRWIIQGYLGLVDGNQTELTAQDQIETIVAAFRGDETLGDVIDTTIIENQAGLQMEGFEPVMFANVLCHSIRFSLLTQHFEQRFKDAVGLDDFVTGGVDYDIAPTDGQLEGQDLIKPEQT